MPIAGRVPPDQQAPTLPRYLVLGRLSTRTIQPGSCALCHRRGSDGRGHPNLGARTPKTRRPAKNKHFLETARARPQRFASTAAWPWSFGQKHDAGFAPMGPAGLVPARASRRAGRSTAEQRARSRREEEGTVAPRRWRAGSVPPGDTSQRRRIRRRDRGSTRNPRSLRQQVQ